jgi:hypothetical protein
VSSIAAGAWPPAPTQARGQAGRHDGGGQVSSKSGAGIACRFSVSPPINWAHQGDLSAIYSDTASDLIAVPIFRSTLFSYVT